MSGMSDVYKNLRHTRLEKRLNEEKMNEERDTESIVSQAFEDAGLYPGSYFKGNDGVVIDSLNTVHAESDNDNVLEMTIEVLSDNKIEVTVETDKNVEYHTFVIDVDKEEETASLPDDVGDFLSVIYDGWLDRVSDSDEEQVNEYRSEDIVKSSEKRISRGDDYIRKIFDSDISNDEKIEKILKAKKLSGKVTKEQKDVLIRDLQRMSGNRSGNADKHGVTGVWSDEDYIAKAIDRHNAKIDKKYSEKRRKSLSDKEEDDFYKYSPSGSTVQSKRMNKMRRRVEKHGVNEELIDYAEYVRSLSEEEFASHLIFLYEEENDVEDLVHDALIDAGVFPETYFKGYDDVEADSLQEVYYVPEGEEDSDIGLIMTYDLISDSRFTITIETNDDVFDKTFSFKVEGDGVILPDDLMDYISIVYEGWIDRARKVRDNYVWNK